MLYVFDIPTIGHLQIVADSKSEAQSIANSFRGASAVRRVQQYRLDGSGWYRGTGNSSEGNTVKTQWEVVDHKGAVAFSAESISAEACVRGGLFTARAWALKVARENSDPALPQLKAQRVAPQA